MIEILPNRWNYSKQLQYAPTFVSHNIVSRWMVGDRVDLTHLDVRAGLPSRIPPGTRAEVSLGTLFLFSVRDTWDRHDVTVLMMQTITCWQVAVMVCLPDYTQPPPWLHLFSCWPSGWPGWGGCQCPRWPDRTRAFPAPQPWPATDTYILMVSLFTVAIRPSGSLLGCNGRVKF